MVSVQPLPVDRVRDAAARGGDALVLPRRDRPDNVAARIERRGLTTFGMEYVPRISRAQSMDALSSQALVAGYRGAIVAAGRLRQFFPLSMTAAGTVPPAQVVVLGAGRRRPAGDRDLPAAGRGGQGLRRTRRRGRGDPLDGGESPSISGCRVSRAPAATPAR